MVGKRVTRATANSPETFSVKFVFEKETSGTFRYKEIDEKGEMKPPMGSIIGTVYLRKAFLSNVAPCQQLTVTVQQS